MRSHAKIPGRAKPVTRARFSIASTCDGYEVVDDDGRAVSPAYNHANEPLAVAATLNDAAAAGPTALARALGAIEDAPYA